MKNKSIALVVLILFVYSCQKDPIDGKNSIIEHEMESAGENCSSGGLKIISGIDNNENGILEESEIDNIDSLNTRDLKLAVGEEVAELDEDMLDEKAEVENEEELSIENEIDLEEDTISEISDLDIEADDEGVESLKKLLEALSNKEVAASMKGMKISINIELGDN